MTRLTHDPQRPRDLPGDLYRDLPRDLPPDLPHGLPQRPQRRSPPGRRAASTLSGRRLPVRHATRPSPASRWSAVLGLAAAALLGAALPGSAAAQGADQRAAQGADRAAVRIDATVAIQRTAASVPPSWAVAPVRADGTVLFLVRHAEKEAEPAADPPLTDEGRARAELLATLLADAGLDAVWSTDYERTRATAAPLAAGEGLDVELYDPRDLASFAATLTGRGGRALVVGHSNTTPALVELLGGDPGPPIDEPAEYDRLYVVTLTSDGPVTTVLRFGRPFRGG